jgi:hypothetical protein
VLLGNYVGRRDKKEVEIFNGRKQTHKMPENEGRKQHRLRK